MNKPVLNPARSKWRMIKKERAIYLFMLPALITTLVFSYLPMFGNVIAFMDYSPAKGWMGLNSPFVGFQWFRIIFSSKTFIEMILRTMYYNFLLLIVGFPFPVILALLLNELRSKLFKRTVQTITYLPHFVSWVTIGTLLYLLLSSDVAGIVNNIRQFFGAENRIIFFGNAKYFPSILLVSSIYKTMGYGSILYLAAISSIDSQLYEAAVIDGAGKWKQFVHITFQGILPTMVILLILNIGSFFSSSFDQILNLQNTLIRSDTNIITVYAYWEVQKNNYSSAAAISLFQGVANMILLITSNHISRKVTDYGLF